MSSIAILGASRGLGKELVTFIHKESPESTLFLSSRKDTELREMARSSDWILKADFSKAQEQKLVFSALSEFQPSRIFYVAGGGPYGFFQEKDWKDHEWAFVVNFLFPAHLIHMVMNDERFKSTLQQVVVVGSAIAGERPDPKASSYAAAKHAMRGLITSIRLEKPSLDLRLFEPDYMLTDMLPANAWPRQQGIAKSPADEARRLWHWCESSVD